jgi:hypothetical protein
MSRRRAATLVESRGVRTIKISCLFTRNHPGYSTICPKGQLRLERSFDVDRMRVVALDQIVVIAIHGSDHIGEYSADAIGQAAAETGRFGGELQCQVGQFSSLHLGFVWSSACASYCSRILGSQHSPAFQGLPDQHDWNADRDVTRSLEQRHRQSDLLAHADQRGQ